jgi:hypothetical protein
VKPASVFELPLKSTAGFPSGPKAQVRAIRSAPGRRASLAASQCSCGRKVVPGESIAYPLTIDWPWLAEGGFVRRSSDEASPLRLAPRNVPVIPYSYKGAILR